MSWPCILHPVYLPLLCTFTKIKKTIKMVQHPALHPIACLHPFQTPVILVLWPQLYWVLWVIREQGTILFISSDTMYNFTCNVMWINPRVLLMIYYSHLFGPTQVKLLELWSPRSETFMMLPHWILLCSQGCSRRNSLSLDKIAPGEYSLQQVIHRRALICQSLSVCISIVTQLFLYNAFTIWFLNLRTWNFKTLLLQS